MRLILDPKSNVPLYLQIVSAVRDLIGNGTLPPGQRLPTVRQLSEDLGVSRLTVHGAYAELQSLSLIESVVGRGSFVAAGATSRLGGGKASLPALSPGLLSELLLLQNHPNLLSFAQAVPAPESYPIAELGKALRASVYDPQTLGYGSFQGDPILREQVANIAAERGIHASPDDVLIVNGAQQGIDVALRAFTTVDEPILVETPSYPGMLEVAATRGQPVIAIPRDADGPSISAIEAACGSYHPGFLYLVPTYHNPTGRSTTPERRTEIKRVARARDLIVVEDDPYGLLSLDEPAALALASGDEEGRVVYITSFSKTLLPGLRLGAMIAAPERLPPLLAVKRTSDLTCSPILQCALADYLRHGYFDAHLKRVRVLYRERRDVMLGALSRHLPGCRWLEPAGGLGVWVELPEGVNERDLYLAAIEAGVGVARGQAFFPQPVQTAYVRLSYGNHNPEEIERGVSILGTVLREHLRQSKELVTRARREASPLV